MSTVGASRILAFLGSGVFLLSLPIGILSVALLGCSADHPIGPKSPAFDASGNASPASISSNFNGTPISAGSTIWFNAVVKVSGVPSSGATITFANSSIQFAANGTNYSLPVVISAITLSTSATQAATSFAPASQTWQTTVPVTYTGNVFLAGLAYRVPSALPGGINPVTWSGSFTSATPGMSVQWQWAAAVYTQFAIDNNAIGVKPIDGDKLNPYANSDHAGTPENEKASVTGGARGGGGSNWTGGYSATGSAQVQVAAVPPTAPNTVPSGYYATANLVRNPSKFSFQFYRDIVSILFSPSASATQRQAAVDSVGGTVVGGVRLNSVDGFYLVRLPADSQNNRPLDAADKLNGLPGVQVAMPDFVLEQPVAYLRPNDGPGWQKTDWKVVPDSAYNSLTANWALEAVAAPLAWGCAVGDPLTRVAVLDLGLHDDAADLHDNVFESTGIVSLTVDPFYHGTSVSGLIGAVGNNQIGVTGMMWHAALELWDVTQRDSTGAPQNGRRFVDYDLLLHDVTSAANDGARVINMSFYTPQPVDTARWARTVAWFDSAFTGALANAPGRAPLIVVAAGNNGQVTGRSDPYWSLFPTIKNRFPNQTLVVAAGGVRKNSLWAFSSDGPLVDVVAPGNGVTVLTSTGTAPDSGTSFATPLVSGLAGLLFSFDSTLTAQQVRQFIIDGAAHGHLMGGTHPLINAYESLKLAAQRPGAPLCGNHVWVSGNSLVVRRDSHTVDTIATNLPLAPYDWGYVYGYHGGHRIDVSGSGGTSLVSVVYQQGRWQVVPWASDPSLSFSGAFRSYGGSHDGDTTAQLRQIVWNPNPPAFAVNLINPVSGLVTQVTTLAGFIPNYGGNPNDPTSIPGYSSAGHQLIVPIRPGNGLGPSVDFYSVDLVSGGSPRFLWSLPEAYSVITRVSEDGQEVEVTYSLAYPNNLVCRLQYRSLANPSQIADSVTVSPQTPGNPCDARSVGGFSASRVAR